MDKPEVNPEILTKGASTAVTLEGVLDKNGRRNEVGERYDLLDPKFLQRMARVADYGARKYGERNWQEHRLKDGKSGINHALKHLMEYQAGVAHDKGAPSEHLIAVAFNMMMEFYHVTREEEAQKK